uniref:radial spoke head 10 homolog B isoform X3 n=1 Tax=Monopterus albus TaxID=43700 RepID=UPI0009B3D16F|nr:radial spoke head 10 homolog B2 isoform X3 [Monopterus albus]
MRENLCATNPWARAPTPGQMVAPIWGKCMMVYAMGLEPTNVPKMVWYTKGSGIRARGMERVYYNQDKTSWYKGDWVTNNIEGWGVRRYPSGNVYSGEWKNNRKHGEGTMRWRTQQYVGKWVDGVQHGQGTHVWILRRAAGSQYSQSNQYTGDFVQGQRHGQGTFHYAGGAIYEGEWKNNKKHGKSKFTFKDGHIFEGEFVDDQMMTPSLHRNRVLTPLRGAFPLSDSDTAILGPNVALNIECLLDKIPERKHDTELKQVGYVVLRQDTELRSIYSFYSRLSHGHSPDNTFMLSRLQLWRLLKDCNIHHHDITLIQIDHLIKEDATTDIHSPFTPMLFCRLLCCLVIVAYHIYNKDMVSQRNLLASCLSKLMTDNILPNVKNVKGFLFGQPDLSLVAVNYMKRCWEVYQAYCRVNAAPRNDRTMTYRHLLWMFKDLHLLDNKLTTVRLLEIITAESPEPKNLSSCLEQEITFLEFFEVLLGCAEVKCQQVSEGLEESLPRSNTEARKGLPEVEASHSVPVPPSSSTTPEISSLKPVEIEKPSDTVELLLAQDLGGQQDVSEGPQSAEHTQGHRGRGKAMQTSRMELWTQTIHQFFNHFFFPAFEHHQLVTRNVNEHKLCLDKAKQTARGRLSIRRLMNDQMCTAEKLDEHRMKPTVGPSTVHPQVLRALKQSVIKASSALLIHAWMQVKSTNIFLVVKRSLFKCCKIKLCFIKRNNFICLTEG